jgi:hypothetical protein
VGAATYLAPSPGWEKVGMRGKKRMAKPSPLSASSAALSGTAVVACGAIKSPSILSHPERKKYVTAIVVVCPS